MDKSARTPTRASGVVRAPPGLPCGKSKPIRRRVDPVVLIQRLYANPTTVALPTDLPLSHLCIAEAAALGLLQTARRLLRDGASPEEPDAQGWYPLHHAAGLNRQRMVRLLLQRGACVHVRSRSTHSLGGTTPLHLATAANHVEVVAVLLAYGANAHARDSAGYMPLHLACELGYIHIVKMLMRLGAHLDAPLGDWTPLGLARKNRHTEVASILHQCGAQT